MAFAHLHTHSEYSLLDGANRLSELVSHVKELGMDSLAVTDHGNLHAAWSFHEEARRQQIRPILGFEAYMAFGPRQARSRPNWAPANYSHLVLLAQDRTGYRNLVKLSSIGYTEGFYRRPRIDREVLEKHSDGLVCLAACLSGEIALWLRQQQYDRARESATFLAGLFGSERFFLEIQDHGIEDEVTVKEGMLALGQELGLGVVATNDAHYLRRDDAVTHDVLLAISTGADLDDPKRFRFTGSESYVKNEAEMRQLFSAHPETIDLTQAVADRCEFDFEQRYFVPSYPRPPGFADDDSLLLSMVNRGLVVRYGDPLPAEVVERRDYELRVIADAGYAGYFLITQDIINAARARGIPVGPGRGSAAGSMISYGLGITAIDPLEFDLLFERFLNPERVSMPDIDIDFCFERRGEVIEYVRERYGRDSVGQIITFGTMKARAAVKDVARTLGVPPGEADKLTKLIPSGPAYSLTVKEAAAKVPELTELLDGNPLYRRVFDLASRIEGMARHASVHAAGVVIAPGPLTDYVPVCTATGKGTSQDAIICQYEMRALERVGMLKMDLLGLRTLTVLHDAVLMIAERTGEPVIDLDALPFDDPLVYSTLRSGSTAGVFQFESPLATDTLRAMKCDRFDDLVASNALLRPGPLDAGMHTVFIHRKLGEEPVSYLHPSLEPILESTYGVITYQEQLMRIANVIAGFSLAEADVLRKAVGKKDGELIRRELKRFVARAIEQGHDRALARELATQIKTFGRYGFNKSHSVAYSVLSYQTAWLKAHHPAEFMAALLSSEIGSTDKVVKYINATRELGIEVLPPDVHESGFKFTVTGENRIRFGLGAVRNVGSGAIESIIAAREQGRFKDLLDFSSRIDLRLCNKRVLESLVMAGACDSLGDNRAQLMAALDQVLGEAQLVQEEAAVGQESLFDTGSTTTTVVPQLPEVAPWPQSERLAREKEILGFFISGHPLEPHRGAAEVFGTRTTATLGEWTEHQVSVAAVVTGIKRQVSRKSGKEYARLTLEDFHGIAEAIVFPEAWARLNREIVIDAPLLLSGGYSERDRDEEVAPFIVESARPLVDLEREGEVALAIRWDSSQPPRPAAAAGLAGVALSHPGPAPLYIDWSDGNGGRVRLRSRNLKVEPRPATLGALRELVGAEAVSFVRSE